MVSLMDFLLIRHERLSTLQRRQVLDIELLAEQKPLAGDAYGALHALTARPVCDIQGFALVVDDVPRGFFLLKRRSLLPRWASGQTATLHALMVDRRFQRLGLGRRCVKLLPSLARELWPEVTQLMLAVAPENQAAHSLYRALGWHDDGDADRSATGFERRMMLKLV
jgi:ribosomal protein S18 acetylase RimI-like enzyme